MKHHGAKGKHAMPKFGEDGTSGIANKKPDHPPKGCVGQAHVRAKECTRAGSGK